MYQLLNETQCILVSYFGSHGHSSIHCHLCRGALPLTGKYKGSTWLKYYKKLSVSHCTVGVSMQSHTYNDGTYLLKL